MTKFQNRVSPLRRILGKIGVIGMGGVDDVIGKMQSISTVARTHYFQSGGGETTTMVGLTTFFIFFTAVTGAGGVGGVFHGKILHYAIFYLPYKSVGYNLNIIKEG